MKCIVCNTPTDQLTHEHVRVHVCPAGHGMWIQPEDLLVAIRTDPNSAGRTNTADEVNAILEVQERDVEPDDDTRVCPMCARPMGSVRYGYTSDVIIDACVTHGIWLDAGELDALELWAAPLRA
jgi:Zn-finger nucleic acid-binding protein